MKNPNDILRRIEIKGLEYDIERCEEMLELLEPVKEASEQALWEWDEDVKAGKVNWTTPKQRESNRVHLQCRIDEDLAKMEDYRRQIREAKARLAELS